MSMGQIVIHGAREHNLKNVHLELPRGHYIVITGVSGSGKSSLAFDTLFVEGYRKYMECLSAKARQELAAVKQPDLDYIEGLSPVIAIEQHIGGQANPRSTVASITEILDYAQLLWVAEGDFRCPKDGGRIFKQSLDNCIERIYEEPVHSRLMVLAPYLSGVKYSLLREELESIKQKGFSRIRLNGHVIHLDEVELGSLAKGKPYRIDLVVDRVLLEPEQRSRIADSLELAFREGGHQACIMVQETKDAPWRELLLSETWSCECCGTVYPEVSKKHFSYNHAEGACLKCGGLGEVFQFQESLIIPDASLSIKEGAIKPLRVGSKATIIRNKALLKQLSEQLPFDYNASWEDLSLEVKQAILHGVEGRTFLFKFGRRKAQEMPYEGVLNVLSQLQRASKSDGYKARLMAYQMASPCPVCNGNRLGVIANNVFYRNRLLPDFLNMDVTSALNFIDSILDEPQASLALEDALRAIARRLFYMRELGLGYLALSRTYVSLSGGESQRVRLATQLGMGLVGVLYILDEPSIGLHPMDTEKLKKTLQDLKDQGNTVLVVEHDDLLMRASDYLVEMGPGPGEHGGSVMYAGSYQHCLEEGNSLTAQYLLQKLRIEKDVKDEVPGASWLSVYGASEHNLKDIDVSFPVGLLTTVCGVSGSGKSTLVNDIVAKAGLRKLNKAKSIPGVHKGIEGFEYFERVVCVDQSPIGRSPRSNPATFVQLFDPLRTVFAQCPLAKVRGYKSSRFSFNVRGGRCERCQGDGMIRHSMQFLGDVFNECPSCEGKRYNRETLEVRFKGYSIADVLDLTVDRALEVFKHIQKIATKLSLLQKVGLGYLKLGQPAPTLSGGEAQRLKLALELSKHKTGRTLYILDEPTTGLHWEDVQKLLSVLFELRDAGNTILVIEHHMDVIRLSDWLIELGPEGGEQGGSLVYSGAPEVLIREGQTKTAEALRR